MIITHPAHAMFLLELENGMRIVIDPTDPGSGFAGEPIACDAVLVSHGHHDHCCMDSVRGYTQVIDTEGVHTLAPDVTVTAIGAYHDDAQGAKRGRTLMFLLAAEKLRVAHLGDLGHELTPEQQSALRCDILMVPVGGFYSIGPAMARKTALQLKPRTVIPMHYAIGATASWPIAPVEDYLARCPEITPSRLPLMRVTAGDLLCQPELVVMEA